MNMSANKKVVAIATKNAKGADTSAPKKPSPTINVEALKKEIFEGIQKKPPDTVINNIEGVLNQLVVKSLDNDCFGYAFNWYVRIRHLEKFENECQLLTKILNYIKKNHSHLYMLAFQAAVENAIEYTITKPENKFSTFIKVFIAQRINVNPNDEHIYFNLMLNCLYKNHCLAETDAAKLAADSNCCAESIAEFRSNPKLLYPEIFPEASRFIDSNLRVVTAEQMLKAKKLADDAAARVDARQKLAAEKILAKLQKLSDDDLYYELKYKMTLNALHRDAVAIEPQFLYFFAKEIHAKWPREKAATLEEMVKTFLKANNYLDIPYHDNFTLTEILTPAITTAAMTAMATATEAATKATTSTAAKPFLPMATTAFAASASSLLIDTDATAIYKPANTSRIPIIKGILSAEKHFQIT